MKFDFIFFFEVWNGRVENTGFVDWKGGGIAKTGENERLEKILRETRPKTAVKKGRGDKKSPERKTLAALKRFK